MAQSATLVAMSQLVDLSLNCHEGIINFQALHTLLHVMIQQLNLQEVAVEFRGADSDKIQAMISTIKPGAPPSFVEYGVVGGDRANVGKKTKKPSGKKTSLQDVVKVRNLAEEKKEKEIRVIERRKDSTEDPDLNPLPLKSPQGSLLIPTDLQTVVLVESHANLPQYTVAVSKTAFDSIQGDIETIKTQIKELADLPGNLGLMEATRTQSSPILDMFQILSLTKRTDANELAVEKLGSLVDDYIKQGGGEFVGRGHDTKESVEAVAHLEERITDLETVVKQIADQSPHLIDTIPEEGSPTPKDAASLKSDKVSVGTQGEVGSVASTKERPSTKPESIKIWEPQGIYISVMEGIDVNDLAPNEVLALVQQEFANLQSWMTQSIKEVDRKYFSPGGGDIDSEVVNSKFKECTAKMEELNELYNTQIGLLNEQFNNVQQEVNDVVNKLEVILPGGDSTGINAETTLDLANKLLILEKEIVSISDRATKMQEEKDERDRQTEAILEQIDILKIVKANREDLEDALGDKADACMINRKVSHDQFDAACDDLSRGIEEALTKLEEQEEMWHQALESIQKDVGNKLDKMEVDPLRDFVNSKLRALQEKFKSLTALKREQEAAGTKSKLLRNVNCISCDKDVVMRKEMDASLKPKAYAMPPGRNMAPYLAYELDQLRKQQKCVPHSRNLNFLESALKTRGSKDKDHICNRYCGGSHTITTPQQRVTRLGHFLEQWGPEIAPLQDEYIRGVDNHMYRARDDSVRKQTKQDGTASGSVRLSKDNLVTRDGEEVRPERDTLVTTEAQDALNTEERKSEPVVDKKMHNIGSTGLSSPEELLEAEGRPSPLESRIGSQEPRASQIPAEGRTSVTPSVRASQAVPAEARMSQAPRASQISAGAPRASQVVEVRMSQAPEPRMSQAPRASQATNEAPRMSQAPEPRMSQAPRASQAASEAPRMSQAPEPRMSQAPRASQAASVGPRASQTIEPRVSQTRRSSQTPAGQIPARISQTSGGPRPSQAGERRQSDVN